MKIVKFYRMGEEGYVDAGEVRLLDDGSVEFSDGPLEETLNSEAVVLAGNRVLRPTDDDKEAWFMALPLGFRGSAFRASEVMEA